MEQDENIVETVRVVAPIVDGNPNGYVVINRCDMTAEHVMFEDFADFEAESAARIEQARPRRGRPPKVREAH